MTMASPAKMVSSRKGAVYPPVSVRSRLAKVAPKEAGKSIILERL